VVVAALTDHLIVARAAPHEVVAARRGRPCELARVATHHVVSIAARDVVIPEATTGEIVSAQGEDPIISVASHDHIRPIGPTDHAGASDGGRLSPTGRRRRLRDTGRREHGRREAD
jgi:hypothetical protein